MTNKKMSNLKPIVSISEMVKMLQLSRARFYQLLQMEFFPKPLHDERSKRPYYDAELQQKILESRHTGVGVNGSFMLFYAPRKSATVADLRRKKVDPQVRELTETLVSMGLQTTVEQVQQGLVELYPDGTDGVDRGVVIRELFRQIKQKMSN